MEQEQLEQQTQVCTQTGETASAAGEQETFEDLIRGKYKADFDARVQKILDGRLRKLRQENESLRRTGADRKAEQARYLAALQAQEREMQGKYPGYRWQEELRNPQFGRLILSGIEPMQAYEAVHARELMERAMRYASDRTRRQVAGSLASGMGRVPENRGRSIAVTSNDPRSLSSSDLADIRRRVLEGEKIRF